MGMGRPLDWGGGGTIAQAPGRVKCASPVAPGRPPDTLQARPAAGSHRPAGLKSSAGAVSRGHPPCAGSHPASIPQAAPGFTRHDRTAMTRRAATETPPKSH